MPTPTCNNSAWRGHSCSGPCTWPARPKAPSNGHRSSVGADWPHTRLQENMHVTMILAPVTRWQCWATPRQQPPAWSCTVSLTGQCKFVSVVAYPSSWAGGTHPACIDLLERWTTRSGPEPEDINMSVGENNRSDKDCKSEAPNIQTWVVAVMDSTNVGTVEQLRLRRRPWGKRKDQRDWSAAAKELQSNTIKRKSSTAGSSLQADTQVTHTTAGWYALKNDFRLWWLIICQDFMSQAPILKQEVERRLTIRICSYIEMAMFANSNDTFLHPVSKGCPFATTTCSKKREGGNSR